MLLTVCSVCAMVPCSSSILNTASFLCISLLILWRKLSTEELMLLNVVLEKTLESPMDYKEIQPVHPKGNQSWIFTGRTYAEAQAPILWPPDVKSRLIRKDPDAGKDWRQEEKGRTEDEVVGWHYWLKGHESEQTLGDSEGQRSLACCSPCGCKESDRA